MDNITCPHCNNVIPKEKLNILTLYFEIKVISCPYCREYLSIPYKDIKHPNMDIMHG